MGDTIHSVYCGFVHSILLLCVFNSIEEPIQLIIATEMCSPLATLGVAV